MSVISGFGEGLGTGSQERREQSRAAARAARDNLSELVGADAVDEDEQAEDEMFELDQAELEALGLTLDDPHQPGP